MNMPVQA